MDVAKALWASLAEWLPEKYFAMHMSFCMLQPGTFPGLGRRLQQPQVQGAEAVGDGLGQKTLIGTSKVLLGVRTVCLSERLAGIGITAITEGLVYLTP